MTELLHYCKNVAYLNGSKYTLCLICSVQLWGGGHFQIQIAKGGMVMTSEQYTTPSLMYYSFWMCLVHAL